MENLTVIIPVHQFNDEIKEYLKKSIGSVFNQNDYTCIIIVAPNDIMNELQLNFSSERITFLLNDEGNTDYCSQVNLAVEQVNTKYFSILGLDDEYSKTWFKNVETYTKHMPEYSIFMPIVSMVDSDTRRNVGSMNEIIWAMSFSNEEIGVIDEETLQSYYDFSTSGAVFRTDDFMEVGMLKPSIKLSFWYEFLLRASNQGLKIYVIPKNGYYQTVNRNNTITSSYNDMGEKERFWWIKLATKEYYFKQERKSSYEYVDEELSKVKGLK